MTKNGDFPIKLTVFSLKSQMSNDQNPYKEII